MAKSLVAVVVAVVIAGATAHGADSPSGERHGLESAKRDYEALRSATRETSDQKLAPPSETFPVLEAAPPSAQPLIPKRTQKKRAGEKDDEKGMARSSNWLIEAMREETDTKTPPEEAWLASETKAEDEVEKGDLVETALALERQDALARKQREERRKESEKRAMDPSANPLTRFMAAWMRPGDFELLAGPNDATNTEPSSGASLVAATETPAPTSLPLGIFSSDTRDRTASSLSSAERGNPYLNPLMELPLPSAGATNAPGASPSISAYSEASVVRAPVDESISAAPPRTPLSETLRGNDDARYFKQLKRF